MKIQDLLIRGDLDGRSLCEAEYKGCLSPVYVRLDNGLWYELAFNDPPCLAAYLSGSFVERDNLFAEPELIVIRTVTLSEIKKALRWLDEDYFCRRVPAPEFSISDDDALYPMDDP